MYKRQAFQHASQYFLIATDETEGNIGPGNDWEAVPGESFKVLGVVEEGIVLASPLPQPGFLAVRAPIGGLPSGETADLEIFNQAGQTLSVENIWSTRVGDNPARILFVAKVRGIGADDTYKPTAAECNEGV